MDIPGSSLPVHNTDRRRSSRSNWSLSLAGSPEGQHRDHHSAAALNTIEHFASSFTRAQSFLQIEAPDHVRERTFFDSHGSPLTAHSYLNQSTFYEDDEDSAMGDYEDEESAFGARANNRFLSHSHSASGSSTEETPLLTNDGYTDDNRGQPSGPGSKVYWTPHHNRHGNIDNLAGHDEDGLSASYKSTASSTIPNVFHAGDLYGSIRSRRVSSWTAQPEDGTVLAEDMALAAGTENDPVIVQKIQNEDGVVTVVVAGQSTAPQTVFNSVNVLIGVGLLSLPLGFYYSGWIFGILFMSFTAGATFYTAKILAKCLDTDHTLVTYADVAYAAFGSRARLLVSLLFTLELMGAGVALVVLFSDSLNALFPSVSQLSFKILAFCILTPPCFLPLQILSFSSIVGIFATFSLVLIVLFDGLYKTEAPGSLLQPMSTWLWPRDWSTLPLAIGIFMSPWGGHAVFPNIYRDMRHPAKYTKCLVSTYQITFLVDVSMGILGFLMFGILVEDEITKNILTDPDYPAQLRVIVTTLIALVPLAKTPLNARPIVSTLDILFGLDSVPWTMSKHLLVPRIAKVLVRVLVVLSFVLMAIVFPQFDRIIAFFGSLLCVTICIILPVVFYLKIYRGQIPTYEIIADYVLLVVFSALAVVGTAWCFM